MRIHRSTCVAMMATAALFLWLNLRINPEASTFFNINNAPNDVDPLTKFLFFRGWPFTPCMYCFLSGRWHPDATVQGAAWADVLILVLAIILAGSVCEWLIRRRQIRDDRAPAK